ncbi:MAG TPA: pitrilysin family protein [Polyangiaceae bacterium]|jgi:zinc protease
MRHLWFLIAAFILFFAGRARATEGAIVQTKLANGLRVVIDENHRLPLVSVAIRYAVGTGNDPENRNGMNEIVMRLMAKKTEHVPENGFDEAIDRVGGTSGYETNVDDTVLYAEVPSNAVETVFWILSDQMGFFEHAVDDAAIGHMVQLLATERGQKVANSPMGLASELVPTELYPAGHPYRHVPRANDAAGLAGLGAAELDAFFDKYYLPSNAVLSVSGDVKSDDVVALANKWFGPIAGGTAPADTAAPIPPLKNQVRLEIAARVERPVVKMTWLAPPEFAPGDAELDVFSNILHGYRIAYLSWDLITKKRLVGEISVHENPHRRGSNFTIVATVTPKHTAQEAADAIDDILRMLQTSHTPDSDDMEGGLSSSLMGPTLEMEASLHRARQFSLWAIRAGDADYWQRDMHRYETDGQRVQDAARTYLPLDRRVVTFVVAEQDRAGLRSARLAESEMKKLALLALAIACGSPPKPVPPKPAPSASVAPSASAAPSASVAAVDPHFREHAPALGPEAPLQMPRLHVSHLGNGMKLITANTGGGMFAMRLVFQGPSSFPTERPAVARLMVNSLFGGTPTYDAHALRRVFEKRFAAWAPYVWPDAVMIDLTMPDDDVRPCLDVMADVVQHASFDQLTLGFELLQLVEQGQTARESPSNVGYDVLEDVLYGNNHVYARPSTVLDGTPNVDRAEVLRVYQEIINPQYATIILAGSVERPLVEHVERLFGAWSAHAVAAPTAVAPITWRTGPRLVVVDRPGSPQSQITFGGLAPSQSSPDVYAMTLIHELLGAHRTSRLTHALVERDASSFTGGTHYEERRAEGSFYWDSSVPIDKTAAVLGEIDKQLDALGREAPPAEELDAWKARYLRHLPLEMETARATGVLIASIPVYKLGDDALDKIADGIHAVTPAAIKTLAAARLSRDHTRAVVVGDWSKLKKDLKALGWGPIEIRDATGKLIRTEK